MTKLKESSCDKTQKLKILLLKNSNYDKIKNHVVAKLKKNEILTKLKKSFCEKTQFHFY